MFVFEEAEFDIENTIGLNYDYIVCAVINKMQADVMKKQLLGLGIREDKILWKQPVNIFQEYFIENECDV